jgi:hypothetical protein
MTEDFMLIESEERINDYSGQIREASKKPSEKLAAQSGDPLDLFRQMKFCKIGKHPVDGHDLNLVEQINQTWTYIAALKATRKLLELHLVSGGYKLAPGAQASLPLDILSVNPGLVGAEVFASVDPDNMGKLKKEVAKMAKLRKEYRYRYVFFLSPKFPCFQQHPKHENGGAQIWSLYFNTTV